MLKDTPFSFDERRDLFIGSTPDIALSFAVEHWIHSAQRAIQQKGRFAVALSGGSTPKAIYAALAKSKKVDWSKVWLFWSDERAAPPTHPESNYKMAIDLLGNLPIPPSQIFRMQAETEIEKNSKNYEELIHTHLGKQLFDLVMLGLGEDGHTASLFPNTTALNEEKSLVAPNLLRDKNLWRMTLTYPCINQSAHTALYVFGSAKQKIVKEVLNAPILSPWPASRIGSSHKSLWILDSQAASLL